MKFWIRSQDKETLKMVEEIDLFCDPNDSKIFYISAYSNILGEYSTKEKALKVLDMIQNYIDEPIYSYHLGGEEYSSYMKSVFQMPQDEEVKV